MSCYQTGNLIEFEVIFRNGPNGQRVDPGVVTFAYQVGTNASVAPITYVSATAPAIGVIGRTGVGRYSTWVDVTSIVGQVTGKWVSTGVGKAETWDTITVEAAPF